VHPLCKQSRVSDVESLVLSNNIDVNACLFVREELELTSKEGKEGTVGSMSIGCTGRGVEIFEEVTSPWNKEQRTKNREQNYCSLFLDFASA